MKDKFKTLHDLETKSSEGGILARLWRKILGELGLLSSIEFYVDKYVSESKRINKKVSIIKRKSKASLISDITADEMTWKVFTNLLFNILGVRKFKVIIQIHHGNNDVSSHELFIADSGSKSNVPEDSTDEPAS